MTDTTKKYVLRFKLEKETKGALRYQEQDEKGPADPAFALIGALYVRKSTLGPNNKPELLTVTIEA